MEEKRIDKSKVKAIHEYYKEFFGKVNKIRKELSIEYNVPIDKVSFKILEDVSPDKNGSKLKVEFTINK